MTTPENTTTRIDGKPASPETEGAAETPAAETASSAQSAPETAEARADRLQAEVDKMREQTLRDRADIDNTRKRLQREKEDAVRYANGSLLEKLLPVMDNFELGLMEAKRTSGEGSAVLIGMGMVQKQLEGFLSDSGMTVIDATGQKFDPNLHEALGEEPSADVPEGNVIRQQRKGYKLRDRLLRPASVFISKGQG